MQDIRTLLRKTSFKTSANSLSQLPNDSRGEIAFAGRSNAGKSSALNMLTGQKTLARTSKTPGRTQLINYFEVKDSLYLVDLPGYGYAKVPLPMREHWQKILQGYFEKRESLDALIMLMDSRHPLTDLDKQMLHWCEFQELPTHILLTKADKLNKNEANKTLHQVRKVLADEFSIPITAQLFSSTKPEIGLQDALHYLSQWVEHHES